MSKAYEPVFAHLYGIKPWELPKLSYDQWQRCKTYADAVLKIQQ